MYVHSKALTQNFLYRPIHKDKQIIYIAAAALTAAADGAAAITAVAGIAATTAAATAATAETAAASS